MHRIFQSAVSIGLFSFACFSLGFGCHVIADIEDRGFAEGAGGASSSSSGDVVSTSSAGTMASGSSSGGGAGGMGSGGSGIPDFPCSSGPPDEESCAGAVDCAMANKSNDACHCGDCDIQCGAACVNSICQPKPLFQLPNTRIHRATVNGGAIYFAAYNEDNNVSDIRVVSFDGMLVSDPLNNFLIDGYVTAIDADCTNVYYSTVANGGMGEQSLWSVPLKGGAQTQIPKPPDADVGGSESIVHDARFVYWTDGRGIGAWEIGTNITAQRISAESGFKAIGLAIDKSELYWTEVRDGNSESHLHRATLNPDGTVVPDTDFLTFPGKFRHIAIDGSNVYGLTFDAASGWWVRYVTRGNLKDAPAAPLVGPPMGFELGEAIFADNSDDYVYFLAVSGGKGMAQRAKKPGIMGGSAVEIPTPQFDEQWLIGDEKRLYLLTPRNDIFGQIDWVGR